MLCYVMLCYVMLCYVMLCHVMLCYVIVSRLVFLSSFSFFSLLFPSFPFFSFLPSFRAEKCQESTKPHSSFFWQSAKLDVDALPSLSAAQVAQVAVPNALHRDGRSLEISPEGLLFSFA